MLLEFSVFPLFPWGRMLVWRRQWQPTPVLLPGKSHGRRSLVGCGPWGHGELNTTEQLQFNFSLSCIREGNGNPLQCSCLENPRTEEAWWAAIYGVAQSQTQLKRLSSSSSVLVRVSCNSESSPLMHACHLQRSPSPSGLPGPPPLWGLDLLPQFTGTL